MHIAFRKSLANGIVTATSAPNWDELKYRLSALDYHDTPEWDHHFAWENFRDGRLVRDSSGLWRYVNFEIDDLTDEAIFAGEFIELEEVDPIFD